MDGLIAAFIGLFGTLFGGAISWWVNLNKTRTELIFELHREFNSESMMQARTQADKLMQKHPKTPLDELYENLPSEETHGVLMVINFYERLWLAIKYNRVDKKLAPQLFGQIFIWWYVICFESLIPQHWNSHSEVRQLKAWMDKSVDRQNHREWMKLAVIAYDERLKEYEMSHIAGVIEPDQKFALGDVGINANLHILSNDHENSSEEAGGRQSAT